MTENISNKSIAILIIVAIVFSIVANWLILRQSSGLLEVTGLQSNEFTSTPHLVLVDFGQAIAGDTVKKTILIKNTRDHSFSASVSIGGQLASFITLSENSFVLAPKSQYEIELVAEIPEYTGKGDYSGTIKIDLYKLQTGT